VEWLYLRAVWSPVMRMSLNVFLHMADVNTAEYFMTDAYVKVAMVMVSAGTLLCAQLYSVLI